MARCRQENISDKKIRIDSYSKIIYGKKRRQKNYCNKKKSTTEVKQIEM
jgi:hypothetical protein